jgi:hypothetical protein
MDELREKLEARLARVSAIMRAANIPHAVIGDNAVAAWVSRADPSLVRQTRDIDILLARADLEPARKAMEAAGFHYRHGAGMDMFLEKPDGRAGDGVHIVIAGEKVHPEAVVASPLVLIDPDSGAFNVIPLDALVQMKLTAYRRKDQVHLLDMISAGLIDETWPSRYPAVLGERLQALLDDPNG